MLDVWRHLPGQGSKAEVGNVCLLCLFFGDWSVEGDASREYRKEMAEEREEGDAWRGTAAHESTSTYYKTLPPS